MYIVVQMIIYQIWQITNVFLNLLNHLMENAMEMVYVTHIMEKPLRTAPQIADVEISTVNINLERHLITAHQIVESAETVNVIRLKVVPPVSKTVVLVKQNRHVAMEHVMGLKTARLVQQIVALVIHIHLGVAMEHVMDQKTAQHVIKIVDIAP